MFTLFPLLSRGISLCLLVILPLMPSLPLFMFSSRLRALWLPTLSPETEVNRA